jgi:ribonuclease HII
VDEAGRGPLAGPVVAAAVTLKHTSFVNRIDDSKKLTALQREKAFFEIGEKAYVGVGIMSEAVIDASNIEKATFLAMTNAIHQVVAKYPSSSLSPSRCDQEICLLIDGNRFYADIPYPVKTIIDGDCLSLSIACASIVAKVIRDRILAIYDRIFPRYGFFQHKGYATVEHKSALRRWGYSPIHRRTFSWEEDV